MNAQEKRAGPPRFVCDVMLGSLARRLRLFGYDVTYSSDASDDSLLIASLQEKRTLLTRDVSLGRSAGRGAVILRSMSLHEQLSQVFSFLGCSCRPRPFSRCSLCNTPLAELPPGSAEGKVPEYVRKQQKSFSCCPGCERVYWEGSHRREMLRSMEPFLPARGEEEG
jgi:uncharacterized protein with PIN domain